MSDVQSRVYPRFLCSGDSALVIELGSEIDPKVNDTVFGLMASIQRASISAIVELVPTYRSLLVSYNPLVMQYDEVVNLLKPVVDRTENQDEPRGEVHVIELPVVYGGDDGPDLETVAEHSGLTPQEVIDVHSGVDYRVYMIGFAPGFPYLGGLDERIATPRLKTPRTNVPAGSVGIAESQTGVYPNESPGGWQLIGRTMHKLFDVTRSAPSFITPGALVRFVPVDSHD